jgi:hypothetical protein
VADLNVEIASVAREMSLSIQQYPMVGFGSRQGSRRLQAIGRIDANAVTTEDGSARVAGGLLGIDDENFLVIESRAGTKWWWLVHTKLRKPVLTAGGEVKRKGNAPMASNESFGIGPQRAVREVKLCLAMNAARNSTRPAARR